MSLRSLAEAKTRQDSRHFWRVSGGNCAPVATGCILVQIQWGLLMRLSFKGRMRVFQTHDQGSIPWSRTP